MSTITSTTEIDGLKARLKDTLSVGVGVAAQILNTSMWWRHGDHLQPIDFSVTFWIVGAIAATSALIFARLAPDAGSSVSGYSQQARSDRKGD